MKTILLLFTSLLLFITPADVRLQYSFKTGDQYELNQSSTQTIKQSIPAMGEIKIDINSGGALLFKVVELQGSSAKIEAKYTKLKVVSKSIMGDINLDSEGSDDNPQNKLVKSVINKPFFFTLSKNGKVDNVNGTESLLQDNDNPVVKQVLEQFLNPSSLKSNLELALINYPDEKIQEGHQWKNSTELPINYPIQIDNTWSLKKIEGSVASIDADGLLATRDKDKITALPNGIKSKADLNGRQALVAKVNTKTGWPNEIKILSEIKGKMTLLAGGFIPEDMDVPMEIVSESKFTIVKK
ncbi:DUF6263 family protein [Chryseosolibacter indicus]|uniref:Uncharacterized protein n=1 Tax=Chryseosolibacter indicus TaxID=2782351 RepID=A0ABS5VVK5_9BACT|nr:DUF6263 family protein [Chryseosolibacter indicus]MBT1705460.1 hypothetical protein [Chryseosolibacter indicus]